MGIYYPSDCEPSEGYTCSPCPDIELERIGALAFVRTDVTFIDIENTAEWNLGIADSKIFVIPNISGSYESTAVTTPRVGHLPDRTLYKNFKINYKDPNFLRNCGFYNWLSEQMNFRVAFCSETVLQISDKAVGIVNSDSYSDDIAKSRVWDISLNWWGKQSPCFYTIPVSVFSCGSAPSYGYLLSEDGQIILGEDGNPIFSF